MPVSKSKRKKARSAPRAASSGAVPGLSALQGVGGAAKLDTEASIVELKAAGSALGPDRLAEAQELTYDAWDAPTAARRVELAAAALLRHPWCGDAYGILAMAVPPTSDDAIHLWRLAAAAGEFALKVELGEDAFETYEGDFWGFLETRPYMRARAGLSNALWNSGEREAAVEIDLDLLRLNPNDNQGARYVAADRLLVLGRDQDLERLFDAYPDEDSAFLSYSRALWAFRREGDSAQSRKALTRALASNRHVPDYLLGRKPMPKSELEYYEPGKDSEAVHYVEAGVEAWRAIPGALDWLGERVNAPGKSAKGKAARGRDK
jgi:tetratricopeptide (TPR) repeat protein